MSSQKTQSKLEYFEIFETRSFGGERLKIFKNRDIISTHGETEMGRSLRRMERDSGAVE